MKTYIVETIVTVNRTVTIQATDEAEARTIAEAGGGVYGDTQEDGIEVTDVSEDDD